MIKKFLISSLLLITSAAVTTATPPGTIEVSEQCATAIAQINKDGGTLYYYCKGVFQAVSERNNPSHRPSDILHFLATEDPRINETTQLSHMPASEYLRLVVSPHFEKLDQAFMAEYHKTEDVNQTWKLFTKYFKLTGLQEAFAEYKRHLIEVDQRTTRTRAHGIFLAADDQTIIIRL